MINFALKQQAVENNLMIEQLQQKHTAEIKELSRKLQASEHQVFQLTQANLDLQNKLIELQDNAKKNQAAKRTLQTTGPGSSGSGHPPEKTAAIESTPLPEKQTPAGSNASVASDLDIFMDEEEITAQQDPTPIDDNMTETSSNKSQRQNSKGVFAKPQKPKTRSSKQ